MKQKADSVDSILPRPRAARRGAALLLSAIATALAACQTVEPAKPGADWRIEPLLRVTNSTETAAAYYTLGRYFQGQNRTQAALEAFYRALALDARHAEAHNAIGAILGTQGNLDGAIRAFEKALAITPAAPHVLSNLGYTLTLAGRHAEALTFLQQAAELEPSNPRTQFNLALVLRALEVKAAAQQVAAELDAVRLDAMAADAVEVSMAEAYVVRLRSAGPDAVELAPAEHVAVLPTTTQPAFAQSRGASFDVAQPNEPQPALVQTAAVQPHAAPATRNPDRTQAGGREATQRAGYRLEVANGNGVTGAAARVAALLAQSGAPTAQLRNQRPFTQKTTVIYFAPGFEYQAQRLVGSFGNLAIRVQPGAPTFADVRVVLGRDVVPVVAAALRRPAG